MSNPDMKIYLVDDDDAVRKTMERLLTHNGYPVVCYNSGVSFLEEAALDGFGCIVLDIAMPGMSGLEVQTELTSRGCQIPVIFMTGHGDVPTSVRALKGGAIEFLEKPFQVELLLERIEEALKFDEARYVESQSNSLVLQNFETLTPREADVMAALVAGLADKSNKEVARDIGLSYRTVEEYRSRIFTKMEASSITHLVEMAKICGIYRS